MKENFDSDDSEGEFAMHNYQKQKLENPVILEKEERERKQKEENKKAFDEWVTQKGLREQALRYLSMIEAPVVEVTAPGTGDAWLEPSGPPGGSRTSRISARSIQNDRGVKLVIEVRACLPSLDFLLAYFARRRWFLTNVT
jgi:hypothetical protein